MTQLSKNLAEAIDAVAALPPDQQNLLALEINERARRLAEPPTKLAPTERAELEAELEAARRGELAEVTQVAAMYTKLGV